MSPQIDPVVAILRKASEQQNCYAVMQLWYMVYDTRL